MAKKREKLSKRLKNYFLKDPKQNFWFHAFILSIFLKYVTPTMLTMIIFLQMGLVAPDLDITNATTVASEKMANSFVGIINTVFEAGSNIAMNNPPFISKILYFGLSYLIYIYWFALFILVLNLIRYGTSWYWRRETQKNRRTSK